MKIKKGDNVLVIAGSNKGKKGKVMRALPADNMVVVEGVNMKKKAKSTAKGQTAAMVSIAMPIHVSNVKKQD